MPSHSRRLERDSRDGGRFESEVRLDDLKNPNMWRERSRLPYCAKCRTAYEEQSRTCPRCDTKSMGYLTQIPDRHMDDARRRAIERIKRARGY